MFHAKTLPQSLGAHVVGISDQRPIGESISTLKMPEACSSLVQMNAIEFHPWGTTVENLEGADRIVFDFGSASLREVERASPQRASFEKHLQSIGPESFVRTSGGKGFHVVVPLHPVAPWDDVKRFAQAFAEATAAMKPGEFVSVAGEKNV